MQISPITIDAGQVSRDHDQFLRSIHEFALGRHPRYPAPDPVPEVFRIDHARQISIPGSDCHHTGIGVRREGRQPGKAAYLCGSGRRSVRLHHRDFRLVERDSQHAHRRYGEGKATISDQMGCFVLKIGRKDTVRFTFVGYKPCTVVMPDTLLEDRYMMGVFLSPDTLQLSEALILRRWGEVQRQNLINARNNMTGILKQAYAPVDYMDADMNQRMMLNEYARSVEMKGHVDVGIGVGTQSVDAYKMLRMRRRVKNQKEWLNPNEIDLLKKIYYLKKKEKQDN